MILQTSAGSVGVDTWYGLDPVSGTWINPTRQRLGLETNQQLSPELEDRACFVVTQTSSYQAEAQLMGRFDVQICDSTLHALVQRRGKRALEQAQERTQLLIAPQTRGQALAPYVRAGAQKPFSLILMMDAWKARYRGKTGDLTQRPNWRIIANGRMSNRR